MLKRPLGDQEASESTKRGKLSQINSASASAPAKVILFGEHAVVYPGKRALACAVGLYTTTTVSPLPNAGSISITLPEVGIKEPLLIDTIQLKNLSTSRDPKALSTDASLIEALDRILSNNIPPLAKRAIQSLLVLYIGICGPDHPSIAIKAHSEIPTGSGLGSSASFCVSLAAALLLSVGDIAEKGRDAKDLQLVNEWALCGETVLHGLVSGVDNTVVTYGGANVFVKGQKLRPVEGFPSLRTLLTNTRVEKDTKKQVGIVTSRMTHFPSVTTPLINSIDEIVGTVCDSLAKSNTNAEICETLNPLIQMNHGILVALGVSHPALEKVVNIAAGKGLMTKLTGAGGGGCCVTLLPDVYEGVDEIKKELEVDCGFECLEAKVGCD
ncbi:hypothetical protein HDU79_009185, partial [Rhizoclosmatium sp. JEL0117]